MRETKIAEIVVGMMTDAEKKSLIGVDVGDTESIKASLKKLTDTGTVFGSILKAVGKDKPVNLGNPSDVDSCRTRLIKFCLRTDGQGLIDKYLMDRGINHNSFLRAVCEAANQSPSSSPSSSDPSTLQPQLSRVGL